MLRKKFSLGFQEDDPGMGEKFPDDKTRPPETGPSLKQVLEEIAARSPKDSRDVKMLLMMYQGKKDVHQISAAINAEVDDPKLQVAHSAVYSIIAKLEREVYEICKFEFPMHAVLLEKERALRWKKGEGEKTKPQIQPTVDQIRQKIQSSSTNRKTLNSGSTVNKPKRRSQEEMYRDLESQQKTLTGPRKTLDKILTRLSNIFWHLK